MGNTSRPTSVTALASDGYAQGRLDRKCEDTITITAQWENLSPDGLGVCPQAGTVPGKGTAIYTSSWVAPTSDVHTQQRFNYMGQNGEINVSQAHRGYYMSDDTSGYKSVNPMYMKFTPTDGKFAGQNGYGYRSFENFIDAALAVNAGTAKATDFDSKLATVATTFRATAILEAGRRSLDTGKTIQILYEDKKDKCLPTGMKVQGAR
jgi:D-galacturonate reductase